MEREYKRPLLPSWIKAYLHINCCLFHVSFAGSLGIALSISNTEHIHLPQCLLIIHSATRVVPQHVGLIFVTPLWQELLHTHYRPIFMMRCSRPQILFQVYLHHTLCFSCRALAVAGTCCVFYTSCVFASTVSLQNLSPCAFPSQIMHVGTSSQPWHVELLLLLSGFLELSHKLAWWCVWEGNHCYQEGNV